MSQGHALVIGGTGMLSEVTVWLNNKGYFVSVIGRRKERYHQLMEKVESPENISSILVDYHKTDELRQALTEAIENHGAFDRVVAWVHSSAPDVIPTLLKLQEQYHREKGFELFHVKSSTSYFVEEETPELPDGCTYSEIFLGFKQSSGHSRWLTHEEISEGIKDSIHHSRPQTIVGQIEPWEQRPH
ncbi:short-chain dehydrogenase [Salinibacillus aidingensis]|uniref:Short-chain dehydrogenase n=1 Tax=Salinibacillus aidingensis TaxID=237684 RepID=A0ABN1BN29_9BACI